LPFELFVALRYLREGRLQTSLILTGIGVGVGVIVFLSALITGLQASLIEQTLGTQAHVIVQPPEEMPRVLPVPAGEAQIAEIQRPPQRIQSIREWQRVEAILRRTDGVVGVAPVVTGPAIAVRGPGSNAVTVRGIDPVSYGAVIDIEDRLVEGRIDLESFQAVLGTALAENLGARVGSRVRIEAAGDRGGVYTVSGVGDFGSETLNERLVFVSLRNAQTLFSLDGGVSSLEVTTGEIFQAEELARRIAGRTGLRSESWIERNQDLVQGLRAQSASSVTIQVFVILAVALGIASVLAVSVVQRSKEIGILRATGTQSGQVTRIFLIQGMVLGTLGSLIGVAFGTGLAILFSQLARGPEQAATFPVALTPWLYVRSVAVALGVGLVSAVVPARGAASTDPATVIRSG
jgi:lipoprotein-releasing system permease protein